MTKLAIKLIEFYQRFFGFIFAHNVFPGAFSPICKFYPTCSEYAAESIKKHGLGEGLVKTAKRISKCHPWASPGIDLP